VLERIGIDVYFPDQGCCGMPTMLEGDRKRTLAFSESNIHRLARLAEAGYDILCSCPTCGYMLKTVLKEGAYYSDAYQAAVGPEPGVIKLPADRRKSGSAEEDFIRLKTSMYGRILKDEGYFSPIDPMARIAVAEKTYDLGGYLRWLSDAGNFDLEFTPVAGKLAYYPPCHLREQEIGRPWLDLLGRIPGVDLIPIDSSFYCCGIAGIMGFKAGFHDTSMEMGAPLMKKIREMGPDTLLTDCLSCRIQFDQMTDLPVHHPVQILDRVLSS
jgi:glycerol-3-phosphate dehydrogenase subunit C